MKMTPMPALLGLHDVAEHHAGLLDAERRGGLVEDQHLGAEVDRAGDGHRLALAAGQRSDRLVGVADVDAHLRHLLAGRRLAKSMSYRRSGPHPFVGSEPRKKFRQIGHQRDHRQVLVDGGDPWPSASRAR
jgi:hypothetical protein